MFKLIHTISENFLSFLFPARCLGCKNPGELICTACLASSRRKAREKTTLPFLDKFYYHGFYQNDLLREALKRFKYHGTKGLSRPFAIVLHELLRPYLASLSENAVVVPVPSSPERARERGYNQAELLAKNLSEKISRPCLAEALLKTKNTPSQTGLSDAERIFNVKNSFAVAKPEAVAGRTVILVDDISTTGATLSETARVLKQAGAKEIIGLAVAKG